MPTKQQLEAENAAQRDIIAAQAQEIYALRDIFTAARECRHDANYVVGYIGGIGTDEYSWGNARLLRAFAEQLRGAVQDDKATWCPATTEADGAAECGVTVYCDRKRGHEGSHSAPGPDEGSEIAWGDVSGEEGDCPARQPDGPGCLGYLCTLAAGHEPPHKAGGPGGAVYATWTDDAADDAEFAHIAIGDQP
jgi:hypothetical protein